MNIYRFGYWSYGSDDSILLRHPTKDSTEYKVDIQNACLAALKRTNKSLRESFDVAVNEILALGYEKVMPTSFVPFGGISIDDKIDADVLKNMCQDKDSQTLIASLNK
jgi:hypothetical protein